VFQNFSIKFCVVLEFPEVKFSLGVVNVYIAESFFIHKSNFSFYCVILDTPESKIHHLVDTSGSLLPCVRQIHHDVELEHFSYYRVVIDGLESNFTILTPLSQILPC
jgi:hypothetical protein